MKKIQNLLCCCLLTLTFFVKAQDRMEEPNRSRKAFMGVTLGASWGDGVSIKAVSEDYGAARAGLQKGDIITAINKDNINNNDDFNRVLRKYKPSEEVEVFFLREKDKKSLKVKLAESPNDNNWGNLSVELGNLGNLSVDLDELKEEMKEIKEDIKEDLEDMDINVGTSEQVRLGVYPETNWEARAVCIGGFTKKSAAKDAGLEKGDLILKIDKNETNTEEELRYELKKYQPGDEVSITYLRGKKEKTTKVKLGSEKVYGWKKNMSYNDSEGWSSGYSSSNEDNKETRTWSSYTFADGTQVELNDFKITPSTDKKVMISFQSKLDKPFSVVVYDSNGKEMAREDRPSLDATFEKQFDLNAASGSEPYFVKLWINGREAFSQKINPIK